MSVGVLSQVTTVLLQWLLLSSYIFNDLYAQDRALCDRLQPLGLWLDTEQQAIKCYD